MVSYLAAQKQKVRITLDLEVFQDFDARQIDWDKLFNLEPSENVEAYVEEFDNVDY
jgi:beta-lactamase class A|tara:strand:- start:178 stop:345 length:168 start_codon:yes stop_codon:yes gene_type:complete